MNKIFLHRGFGIDVLTEERQRAEGRRLLWIYPFSDCPNHRKGRREQGFKHWCQLNVKPGL
ncbi:hypothetical protein A6S26_20270 [Nostoc sp. ATCC 43529]|nr:hypothetical protein A6S26_20270 [Nostoc sp. ATCC 43529]